MGRDKPPISENTPENIEKSLERDFLATYEKFNNITSLVEKQNVIYKLCLAYENYLGPQENYAENIFSKIDFKNGVDLTLFNFIFSIAKVAKAYKLEGTNKSAEKYFRSICLELEDKNYLMHYVPKHFLGILEGHIQQEYDHSLYTRLDSETFITKKEDGNIYRSKPEDQTRIINNWKESAKLEWIEIPNVEDKKQVDSIGLQIKNIKEELDELHSSEYLLDGSFFGLGRFIQEEDLLKYVDILKQEIEYLDSLASEIINKNNPDIDERYAKADNLHIENDFLFSEKFTFDTFKSKLMGSNLDSKELYNDYKTFLSEPDIREFIKTDLGFDFTQYTFQEQVYFLNYLKGVSIKKSREIKKFSEDYGHVGVRTFFSISYGGKEMGDKILILGEKLPEVAQKVFLKYGEIINIANNAEEEIKNIFGDKEISDKVLTSTKEALLRRGAKLLSDLGDKVMYKDFKINEQEILGELEEIKAETILLGASYAKLFREGISVPIEEITETEEISTKNLTNEQKQELLKVYMNGRPKVTYENEEHLELLRKEFEEELNNENISVFNIRFNGDIIIFAIVDKKDKDTLYVGGLTFVDEVRNAVIAEASMNCVLKMFKNYNIKALVDSRNPILRMYQKRFGFNIVKELPREENAGELYYEIERPKSVSIEQDSKEKQEYGLAA